MTPSGKIEILFICGSLENGIDGVGDYTRRLAQEVARQGVSVGVLAINDPFVEIVLENTQCIYGIPVKQIRLPKLLKKTKRYHQAEMWITKLNPQWISLQFVSFTFNSKGLPLDLGFWLRRIGKGRNWHLMFHELWVGLNIISPVKEKFWGYLQRATIYVLISILKPKLIQTQTRLYQEKLQHLGFTTGYLPLFGNIPIVNWNVTSNDPHATKDPANSIFNLILFGAIHPNGLHREFIHEIALLAEETRMDIKFTFIGRSGIYLDLWVNNLKKENLAFKIIGETDVVNISKALTTSSIGVSTTPIALAEKSGTVAAMLEHGLPVICVSDWWKSKKSRYKYLHTHIYEYQIGILKTTLSSMKKEDRQSKIETITVQLIKELNLIPHVKK